MKSIKRYDCGSYYVWLNESKLEHREDGPAVIHKKNEYKMWYQLGRLHRIDGPAVEYKDEWRWYENGKLHRADGPAVDYSNGDKSWYLNGKLHREDGPAIELSNGHKEWWIHGEYIHCSSQKEFEKLIKLQAFW